MGVYYAAICNTRKTSFQLPNIKIDLYRYTLPIQRWTALEKVPNQVIPFLNWQWKHRDHDTELCCDAGGTEEAWAKAGLYNEEIMGWDNE